MTEYSKSHAEGREVKNAAMSATFQNEREGSDRLLMRTAIVYNSGFGFQIESPQQYV